MENNQMENNSDQQVEESQLQNEQQQQDSDQQTQANNLENQGQIDDQEQEQYLIGNQSQQLEQLIFGLNNNIFLQESNIDHIFNILLLNVPSALDSIDLRDVQIESDIYYKQEILKIQEQSLRIQQMMQSQQRIQDLSQIEDIKQLHDKYDLLQQQELQNIEIQRQIQEQKLRIYMIQQEDQVEKILNQKFDQILDKRSSSFDCILDNTIKLYSERYLDGEISHLEKLMKILKSKKKDMIITKIQLPNFQIGRPEEQQQAVENLQNEQSQNISGQLSDTQIDLTSPIYSLQNQLRQLYNVKDNCITFKLNKIYEVKIKAVDDNVHQLHLQKQNSLFNRLPNMIIKEHILSFFSAFELFKLRYVCNEWRELVRELWYKTFKREMQLQLKAADLCNEIEQQFKLLNIRQPFYAKFDIFLRALIDLFDFEQFKETYFTENNEHRNIIQKLIKCFFHITARNLDSIESGKNEDPEQQQQLSEQIEQDSLDEWAKLKKFCAENLYNLMQESLGNNFNFPSKEKLIKIKDKHLNDYDISEQNLKDINDKQLIIFQLFVKQLQVYGTLKNSIIIAGKYLIQTKKRLRLISSFWPQKKGFLEGAYKILLFRNVKIIDNQIIANDDSESAFGPLSNLESIAQQALSGQFLFSPLSFNGCDHQQNSQKEGDVMVEENNGNASMQTISKSEQQINQNSLQQQNQYDSSSLQDKISQYKQLVLESEKKQEDDKQFLSSHLEQNKPENQLANDDKIQIKQENVEEMESEDPLNLSIANLQETIQMKQQRIEQLKDLNQNYRQKLQFIKEDIQKIENNLLQIEHNMKNVQSLKDNIKDLENNVGIIDSNIKKINESIQFIKLQEFNLKNKSANLSPPPDFVLRKDGFETRIYFDKQIKADIILTSIVKMGPDAIKKLVDLMQPLDKNQDLNQQKL